MLQESGLPELLTIAELGRLFRASSPRPLPAADAMALAGLEGSAGRRFGDLSGGQRQRVFFALAVCGDPEMLFLDEPTVAMDVEGRRLFIRAIGEWAGRGRTVLLTTHHLEEADLMADRVVVIDRGVVIADDSPDGIRARVPGRRGPPRPPAPLPPGAVASPPVSPPPPQDPRARLLTPHPPGVLVAPRARPA